MQKEYTYSFEKVKIKIKLLFKPAHGSKMDVSEKQRDYWFDNFDDFGNKIKVEFFSIKFDDRK